MEEKYLVYIEIFKTESFEIDVSYRSMLYYNFFIV